MKVLIDTNICLDVYLQREPFFRSAQQLFALAHQHELEMLITSLTVINMEYLIDRLDKTADKKLAIRHLVEIAKIIPVDGQQIRDAIDSDFTDFEDAVQYFAGITANIEYIISRDFKGFNHANVPVISPEQYLKIFH